MDLKIKDVAELLNVSETTLKRWVAEAKIPYYRLGGQVCFSPDEIENWVLNSRGELPPFATEADDPLEAVEERLGTRRFALFRAIHKGGVWNRVPGNNKEEVIQNSMRLIGRDLKLDPDLLTNLLLDREKLMPTALSRGVAVPHTRDFLLQDSYDIVAVVFPEKPIEYGALDKQPVHTLFFLFACDDKRHLHLLAKIAHLSSKPELLKKLRAHSTKSEVLETVREWEGMLHARDPKLASVN